MMWEENDSGGGGGRNLFLAIVQAAVVVALFAVGAELYKRYEERKEAERHLAYATIAYSESADAYLMNGAYDQAIEDYGKVIELNPDWGLPYINRGISYLNRGDKSDIGRAITDCTKGIELEPEIPAGYICRGRAYTETKNNDGVLADYSRAIEINPKDAFSHNNLAWLLSTCPSEGRRDGERAIELARRACELTSWGNYAYIDTLAAAHAEAGNFGEAVKWQEKAGEMVKDRGFNQALGGCVERLELYRRQKPYRQVEK